MARFVSASAQQARDPSLKPTDILAARAIAQAAIDVELFTIPLYMASLYSIAGRHEINLGGSALYKGRMWPGPATTIAPSNANEEAFNILFSIFIQEMLHLQMAANMATAIGVKQPSFTSLSLQTPNHGWKCYAPHLTIIPNIVDLADTVNEDVAVDIGPLDAERIELFLAIEQPEAQAKAAIKPDKIGKYFPPAPFAGWAPGQPLPMFGTIGWMYQCYYDYLHVAYADGTTLLDALFDPGSVQQDLFNSVPGAKQYPGFSATVTATDPAGALAQMSAMMDAITDQGEGSTLRPAPAAALTAVEPVYRSDLAALEQLYPSYDDSGDQLPQSADANARYPNDALDHYERFQKLQAMLPQITTWAMAGKTGNWTASDFEASDYDGSNPYGLPDTADLAAAINAIAHEGCFEGSYALMSQAVTGAIAGVTTVLNDFWQNKQAVFPMPAMGGTGNRMATIWAALGRAPDLSLGLDPPQQGVLYHACQGIDYTSGGGNDCAQVGVFHSCIGSNACHAQGGCGFVNKVTGGGSCGGSSCGAAAQGAGSEAANLRSGCGAPPPPPPRPLCGGPSPPPPPGCGQPTLYSAPGDNKCAGFGGCAVPISASQLYPKNKDGTAKGTMEVFDFAPDPTGFDGWKSVSIGTLPFDEGDRVAKIAYDAFAMVMKHRGQPVPEEPAPSTIRLVFPPST